MNIKIHIYIHTYINNMQHYLLYIGDKTTTKIRTTTTRNRSILEEFTVYVFKRASLQKRIGLQID